MNKAVWLVAWSALLLAGCASIGPPTITYQPRSGDKFARSLMAPIPVVGILSLIQAVEMFFRPTGPDGASLVRVRELLGLDPAKRGFGVVYGSFAGPDAKIAILTRSILQVVTIPAR